jgi:hypothetical protein
MWEIAADVFLLFIWFTIVAGHVLCVATSSHMIIPANFLSMVINDGNYQLRNIFGHRRNILFVCYQYIMIFLHSC